MWRGYGTVTQAIRVLPTQVWNLDVGAQQALSVNGEAA